MATEVTITSQKLKSLLIKEAKKLTNNVPKFTFKTYDGDLLTISFEQAPHSPINVGWVEDFVKCYDNYHHDLDDLEGYTISKGGRKIEVDDNVDKDIALYDEDYIKRVRDYAIDEYIREHNIDIKQEATDNNVTVERMRRWYFETYKPYWLIYNYHYYLKNCISCKLTDRPDDLPFPTSAASKEKTPIKKTKSKKASKTQKLSSIIKDFNASFDKEVAKQKTPIIILDETIDTSNTLRKAKQSSKSSKTNTPQNKPDTKPAEASNQYGDLKQLLTTAAKNFTDDVPSFKVTLSEDKYLFTVSFEQTPHSPINVGWAEDVIKSYNSFYHSKDLDEKDYLSWDYVEVQVRDDILEHIQVFSDKYENSVKEYMIDEYAVENNIDIKAEAADNNISVRAQRDNIFDKCSVSKYYYYLDNCISCKLADRPKKLNPCLTEKLRLQLVYN